MTHQGYPTLQGYFNSYDLVWSNKEDKLEKLSDSNVINFTWIVNPREMLYACIIDPFLVKLPKQSKQCNMFLFNIIFLSNNY